MSDYMAENRVKYYLQNSEGKITTSLDFIHN